MSQLVVHLFYSQRCSQQQLLGKRRYCYGWTGNGTVGFPDADIKNFCTAKPKFGRKTYKELQRQGIQKQCRLCFHVKERDEL